MVGGACATQGIKDRSKIREGMVTRKQGCRDEGETREGKLGEDLEMGVHGEKGRSRGDPGKIHRSREYGVQECWRMEWESGLGQGSPRRGQGQLRVSRGYLVGSDEGARGVRGKENITAGEDELEMETVA